MSPAFAVQAKAILAWQGQVDPRGPMYRVTISPDQHAPSDDRVFVERSGVDRLGAQAWFQLDRFAETVDINNVLSKSFIDVFAALQQVHQRIQQAQKEAIDKSQPQPQSNAKTQESET